MEKIFLSILSLYFLWYFYDFITKIDEKKFYFLLKNFIIYNNFYKKVNMIFNKKIFGKQILFLSNLFKFLKIFYKNRRSKSKNHQKFHNIFHFYFSFCKYFCKFYILKREKITNFFKQKEDKSPLLLALHLNIATLHQQFCQAIDSLGITRAHMKSKLLINSQRDLRHAITITNGQIPNLRYRDIVAVYLALGTLEYLRIEKWALFDFALANRNRCFA